MRPGQVGRRTQLAAVLYDQNILGFNGPRLMTVLLPGLNSDNEVVASQEGLIEQFTSGPQLHHL